MLETMRAVRKDEYGKLWRRVPGSLGVALCIVEIALLGLSTGWWSGVFTICLLTMLSRVVPRDWPPVTWLVDFSYHTVMQTWPLRVLWLLLIMDLWLLHGQSGWSIPIVFALFLGSVIVPFVAGRLFDTLRR